MIILPSEAGTIPRVMSGAPISARHYNSIVDHANNSSQPARPVSDTNQRAPGFRLFTYKRLRSSEVMVCEFEGVEYLVSLPPQFRKSTYKNKTIGGVYYWQKSNPLEREAGAGSDTEPEDREQQVIVPGVYAGDHILAIPNPQIIKIGPDRVEWLDINLQGRAWAKAS